LRLQRDAEIEQRLGMFGMLPEHRAAGGLGGGGIVTLELQLGHVHAGHRLPRFAVQDVTKTFLGERGFPEVAEREAKVDHRVGVVAVEVNGPLVGLGGSEKISFVLRHLAKVEVRGGELGIEFGRALKC